MNVPRTDAFGITPAAAIADCLARSTPLTINPSTRRELNVEFLRAYDTPTGRRRLATVFYAAIRDPAVEEAFVALMAPSEDILRFTRYFVADLFRHTREEGSLSGSELARKFDRVWSGRSSPRSLPPAWRPPDRAE